MEFNRTRQSGGSVNGSSDFRARVIDAAVEALVERGYSGASTVVIQEKAGASRGGLLHYFPSRDELLAAASQHLASSRLRQTERWVEQLIDERVQGVDRVDLAIDLLWSTFHQPYFCAAIELWVAARTNPALAAAVRRQERSLREAIDAVTDRIWGREISVHPSYAEISELIFTSMRGAALPYFFEDRLATQDRHLAIWKTTVRQLLSS